MSDNRDTGVGFVPCDQRLIVSPIYCYRCGTMCQTKLRHIGRYDAQTGDPLVNIVQMCPRKHWWNRHTRMVWLDDETDRPAEIGIGSIVIKEAINGL